MKIAFVTSGLFRHTGGPSIVIANLINQLASKKKYNISYLGVDGDIHPKILNIDKAVSVNNFKVITPYRFSINYFKKLVKLAPDQVWVHGLWLWPNLCGIIYALIFKKKLIITLHGVLTREMFSNKKLKKIIIGFIERVIIILKKNVKLHYLSDQERNSCVLKKYKIDNAVIPNYVFINSNHKIKRDKDFVFLARIAPIKGVEDIVKLDTFKCDIYGFGDKTYIKKVFGSKNNYLGEVESNEVKDIYSAYKFYVLPSYGEGLPTSAIEAAMCNCILVISNQCNLNMFNDGVDCIKFDAGIENLQNAIKLAKSLTQSELEIMLANSKKIITNHFSSIVLDEKYSNLLEQW